jgi:RecB family exonuclease
MAALVHPITAAPEQSGAVLSPSQVSTWLDCPARWYFRYALGLPDPPNAALAVGSTVHTIAAMLCHNVLAGEPLDALDAESVRLLAQRAFRQEIEKAELAPEEDRAALEEQTLQLCEYFRAQVLPALRPVAVEQEVRGVINGVPVRGFVDLVDADAGVVDLKTASKKPAGVSPAHLLQLATYSQLLGEPRTRLITITKTKVPAHHPFTLTMEPRHVRYAEHMYALAAEGIASGLYPPRRASMLCSRKNCAYWRECEREYGGEVQP